MTLGQIAEAMHARLAFGSADTFVQRLSTDTRTLQPGDFFLAAPTTNFHI